MPTDVRVDDLDVARGAGALVLGFRGSDEHTAGHVPGGALLPLSVLTVRVQDLPQTEPVFVACQSGGRCAQAAVLLDQAGMDVRHVGGASAWISSGRPVETGAPRR